MTTNVLLYDGETPAEAGFWGYSGDWAAGCGVKAEKGHI